MTTKLPITKLTKDESNKFMCLVENKLKQIQTESDYLYLKNKADIQMLLTESHHLIWALNNKAHEFLGEFFEPTVLPGIPYHNQNDIPLSVNTYLELKDNFNVYLLFSNDNVATLFVTQLVLNDILEETIVKEGKNE